MVKYMTRQRILLLEYLEQHPDELLSVHQIADDLKEEKISVSAIYRNFADLEAEGKVRRTSQHGKRKLYFQYTASEHCRKNLHLRCQRCGKTYHLSSELAEEITQSLANTEKFEISIANTVIYGICNLCSK